LEKKKKKRLKMSSEELKSPRVEEAKEIIEFILNDSDIIDRMNAKEHGFIESMQDRLNYWGGSTFVSEKQLNWLKIIKEKYERT